MANDLVVTEAVSRSTFQINEFTPLLAHALLGSLRLLKNADAMLAVCVEGVQASAEKCGRYVDHSETIITAFLPQLGYERAEALLKEYRVAGGGNIRDFLETRFGKDLVAKVLSPQALLSLGYQKNG